jgi:hypothetical protein
MHKKLEADLISLAHSVLQMKNKENVFALKEKAQEIYEKLSVLAHVEEYIKEKPNAKETKEALISTVEQSFDLKEKAIAVVEEKESISHQVAEEDEEESQMDEMANEVADTIMESIENETVESFIEQPFDELEKLFGEVATKVKDDLQEVEKQKTPTLEEELQGTLPIDIAAELFEKVVPKSLNDQLQTNIQIGLNDRIVFVKNLFNGSQEDFNRVVSQLNTHKSAKEAKKFINKMVKPDYDWKEHEALETRFMEIIARRFA